MDEKKSGVLYLSYDGLTDPLGQSQVLPYILGLEKGGYKFHVISFEKKQNYARRKATIEKLIHNRNVVWTPKLYHKNPPILSTLFDYLTLIKHAKRIVRKERIQMVHCRSYIPGLVGAILQKKFGCLFLFDIRGFWADERVDGGIWDKHNFIYRTIYHFFKRKEADLMVSADHIISLTEVGKEEICSGRLFYDKIKRVEDEKVSVIPCTVDLTLFEPKRISVQAKSELKTKLDLARGTKVMVYLGSIGTWYMLKEMLEFFSVVLNHSPDTVFLFLTVEDKNMIESAARSLDIDVDRLIVISSERKDVPLYLSISDYGILFITPFYSKKASSPTKLGEMLAMGLPIIGNKGVGDMDFLVTKSNAIQLIEAFEETQYRASFEALMESENDPLQLRELANNHFSLELGISTYKAVYRKLSLHL